MVTSKGGLEALCREEGCVLKVYHCKPDPPDTWTVGVGHVVLPEDHLAPGDTITKERALELLARDVQKCERCIADHVKVPLNQNQYDALVSLIFNIGTSGFASSTILRLLNAGDYADAAAHFLDWRRANADPKFLLARRKRERVMFETPVPPALEPLDAAYTEQVLNNLIFQPDFPRG